MLIGPPYPNIDECKEGNSTTTRPSTTKLTTDSTTSSILSSSTSEKASSTPSFTTTTSIHVTSTHTSPSSTLITSSATTFATKTSTTTVVPTTTKNTDAFALLIIGGFQDSNVRLSNVEIVDPFNKHTNCTTLNDFPDTREGMVAEMFEGNPFVCGGSNGENLNSCFNYISRDWNKSDRLLLRYKDV